MFDAAYTYENGMTVQDVDMGVEYSYNGVTLSIIGEQDTGEIHLNDVYVGEYERDGDDVVVLAANGKEVARFCSDSDSFDNFAAQMLRVGE